MSRLQQIAHKIREIRKKRNISQEKLAELASMNFRSICRIENNCNAPTIETLEKIADALEVPLEIFLDTTGNETKESIVSKVNNIMDKMELDDLKRLYRVIYNFYS